MKISSAFSLQTSQSNKRWFIYGWLFLGISLILSLGACASQPRRSVSTSVPEVVAPGGTLQPATISTLIVTTDSATKVGFKVAGWT